MNENAFAQLPLAAELLSNLNSLGYKQMTPIQAQALPIVLQGQDLVAQAATGSGKTAAFGLSLLQNLDRSSFNPQVLVLAPTRELAEQIAVELRRLARAMPNVKVLTLIGGTPLPPQAKALSKGAQIIIGTPGRVEDHLGKGTLALAKLTTLVLDEADRMLDMGFQESIDHILSQLPSNRQTLLFSATYPEKIQAITRRVMRSPKMVILENTDNSALIEQRFYPIKDELERLLALQLVLQQQRPDSALVFCATKNDVRTVTEQLARSGHSALALHGDLEQRERDEVLVRFSNKSIPILVATDVAARGLDIEALDLVINYQPARDPQVHTHRIGRTGRAGEAGLACTLYNAREAQKLAVSTTDFKDDAGALPLPPKGLLDQPPLRAIWSTVVIEAGRKSKIRPGDLVGAITSGGEFKGEQLGKITVQALKSYVAVDRAVAKKVAKKLVDTKLKGRKLKARLLAG